MERKNETKKTKDKRNRRLVITCVIKSLMLKLFSLHICNNSTAVVLSAYRQPQKDERR